MPSAALCHISDVVLMELEQRAQALSTHASTRIEGNPQPLTEVNNILKAIQKNLRASEREVVNYNAALKNLGALLQERTPQFSHKLILDIHQTVMKGLMERHDDWGVAGSAVRFASDV